MELCFYYLLSKIEGYLPPTLTGAITSIQTTKHKRERERERERESRISAKKHHFSPVLKLTSAKKNTKSAESK